MSVLIPSLRAAIAVPQWSKDDLWRRARAVPSLDLRFADNKSLVDATTGQNLVTFSRASGGTYVDSQGVIRNATTNLLLRSEEFDDGAWQKSLVSVSPNAVASPSGLLTADKIVEDTSNGGHYIFRGTAVTAGAAYTASFYVKAAERSRVAIRFFSTNSAFSTSDAFFDLSGGTVVAGATVDSASIVSVGDGWYRVIASEVATASATGNVGVYLVSSGTNLVYTGDGTSGIYIWGAQLEQSSTVGEYVPTTSTINSAPRFDHNPSTGESLGLLVEEQRTNLLWPSQFTSFGTTAANNTWFETFAELDATSNAGVAPDGTTTAALLACNTTTGFRAASNRTLRSTAGTYAFSVYCKAASTDVLTRMLISGETAPENYLRADFTLSGSGSASSATVYGTAVSAGSPSIQAIGNGWYRCTVLVTLTAPTNITCLLYPGNGSSQTTASQTLVWGAQLEAGAFPTSYIKTEAATATRAADIASITGTNFSSWYRQDQGSIFLEHSTDSLNTSVFVIDDTTTNNLVTVFNASVANTHASTNFLVSGVNSGRLDAGGTFSARSVRRTCLAFASADRAFAGAGNPASQTTFPATLPTMTRMSIPGASTFAGLSGSRISRLTYWPQRLGNEVLQNLTV